MTTEKEKIEESLAILRKEEAYNLGLIDRKSEAIELGDELIEQYFDSSASVFWDKLKGELAK